MNNMMFLCTAMLFAGSAFANEREVMHLNWVTDDGADCRNVCIDTDPHHWADVNAKNNSGDKKRLANPVSPSGGPPRSHPEVVIKLD